MHIDKDCSVNVSASHRENPRVKLTEMKNKEINHIYPVIDKIVICSSSK